MELNELVSDMITKDAELQKKLRDRVSDALDKVDIQNEVQEALSQCMENVEIDLDTIINTLVKRLLNERIQTVFPKIKEKK